ncbi:hypothetical protein C2S51_013598 [Perilla frutescens var. frutescens]|nr:hypothetical protein C2S51_013598 [Perilla frutescens var. frutescens]
MIERDCKRKKTNKRENFEERSPLQHLNGFPIYKRNTKKCSDLSSPSFSSAPAASRFLLSENPCSSSSFSSSSSRTHLDKKPNIFSKIAKNEPNKSRLHTSNVVPKSKENEIPRKPFLQTSRKEKPQFNMLRQNWQGGPKPSGKNRQRSKLSSVQSKSENKVMKGSREFQENMKNSDEIDSGNRAFELNRVSDGSDSNCAKKCTPMSGNGSHSLSFCDHEFTIEEDSVFDRANAIAATDVKTPPVEASLSPEIQCHSQSKMLVLKSVGTPVCYGAGHLVSGVSDKRKYRRRGSLRGGPEKAVPFLDARRDENENENENVSVDLQESSIPLLAEASVRWHLSPCDLGREDLRIGLDQGRMMVGDDDSDTLDLLYSPSILCGNTSNFLCAKSSYSGSGNVGNVSVKRSSNNVSMDECLLATSPNATYNCNGISSTEGRRDSAILSDVSLNSGNIIQTPDSNSSSDACLRRSRLELHLSNSVWTELDSITGTLDRVKLSPRSEVSMWDAPPISHDPTQLQENVDCVSSWVSDATTIDNLTLSQMRISWCEGLASKIVGTDEFDSCCRLSDEEIDGDEHLKLYTLTEAAEEKETYHGNNSGQRKSVEKKENGFRIGDEFSPVLLDYEPCLDGGGKGKSASSSHRPNAGAESICTDGGGLVASDDSDWTYFQESRLFHVT